MGGPALWQRALWGPCALGGAHGSQGPRGHGESPGGATEPTERRSSLCDIAHLCVGKRARDEQTPRHAAPRRQRWFRPDLHCHARAPACARTKRHTKTHTKRHTRALQNGAQNACAHTHTQQQVLERSSGGRPDMLPARRGAGGSSARVPVRSIAPGYTWIKKKGSSAEFGCRERANAQRREGPAARVREDARSWTRKACLDDGIEELLEVL